LLLEERFANIRQGAAYDVDKTPPPKNFWLDDVKLERWYEDREALRKAYD
jgi:hypothetical protein